MLTEKQKNWYLEKLKNAEENIQEASKNLSPEEFSIKLHNEFFGLLVFLTEINNLKKGTPNNA